MYGSVKQITGVGMAMTMALTILSGCSQTNTSSEQASTSALKDNSVHETVPKQYTKNTLTVDQLVQCVSLKNKLDNMQAKVEAQKSNVVDLQNTMNDVRQKMKIIKSDVQQSKVNQSSNPADVKSYNNKVKEYNHFTQVDAKNTQAYNAAAKKYNVNLQAYNAQQAQYKVACVTNKHFYKEDMDAAKKKVNQQKK